MVVTETASFFLLLLHSFDLSVVALRRCFQPNKQTNKRINMDGQRENDCRQHLLLYTYSKIIVFLLYLYMILNLLPIILMLYKIGIGLCGVISL
jgi:hypothetical protein